MLLTLAALAAGTPALSEPLEPLAFLVGHCWRGEFSKTGDQDTHCFETVYDGAHVRDRHVVIRKGKAPYRGETIYSWNGEKKLVEYTYWNSSGGVSRGGMVPAPGRLVFDDEEHVRTDGSKVTYSTFWRRSGDDAYEAVTTRSDSPTGETVVVYRRVK